MTDENITPEAEVADDMVADLAAEVAEDYSEADYAGGSDFVADADAQFAPVVSSGPAQAVGRRKEAVARVRLLPGSGQFTLNGRSLEEYFPNKVHQQIVNEPLTVLELDGAYDVLVRVHGGGPSGQAGAVRLGVARSLNGVDEELNRPILKKAGFLTRDARVPERKKAGLKKARKASQFSKR